MPIIIIGNNNIIEVITRSTNINIKTQGPKEMNLPRFHERNNYT